MAYDLHFLLSPQDFELISRDLLQASTGKRFESFKEGKDGGIDIRCASSSEGKIIVQAKRYKSWATLKPALEKEVEKVKKVNPDEYILTTTAALSPDNKAKIKAMFDPYIKEEYDIYGNEDLNNLINQYKKIERQYYQLWMSSTNVLDSIVNADVVNASGFEFEKIKADIRMFVDNESTTKALEILQANRYVIISGVPGIGKTTLARFLSYKLLAEGWQDLVYVDDLKEAHKMFKEDCKQIFFFDDFLGSTTYDVQTKNFDGSLINFIDVIKRRKDKLLILTTREYILSEAKGKLEKLAHANFEIAKCVLDLGSYTKPIRAKILYNHIVFSDLDQGCIDNLISKRAYMNIIEHKNFNPRIIETFIDRAEWRNVAVDKFVNHFIGLFDNPYRVWRYAYDGLMQEAQFALLILLTMGSDISLQDWRQAFLYFAENTATTYDLRKDEGTWSAVLKVLSDCFILTDIKNQKNIVNFYNPSVKDFLVNYLNENTEYRNDLIRHACFPVQLTIVFTDRCKERQALQGNVIVSMDAYPLVLASLERLLSIASNPFCLLNDFLLRFPNIYRMNDTFVVNLIKPEFFDAKYISVYHVTSILTKIGEKLSFTITESMLNKVMLSCEAPSEFEDYCGLATKFDLPIDKKYIRDQVESCVDATMYSSSDEVEEDIDIMGRLADYEIYISDELFGYMDDKAKSFDVDYDEDDYEQFKESMSAYEHGLYLEDRAIDDMFSSLKK